MAKVRTKAGSKEAKDKMAAVRAAKKERGPGIGKFVNDLLDKNIDMKTEDVLQKVHDKFPDAKTSKACVAWYRSHHPKHSTLAKSKAVSKKKA